MTRQPKPAKVGDQCHHSRSAMHQFLLDHGRSAMYDPTAVEALDPRDRIRVSRTRVGRPHLVCYRGKHYEVKQVISELSPHPRHQPHKTQMKIRPVGKCNGWCGWAPMFTIVGIFHSSLKSSILLEKLDALAPVPDGIVIYKKGYSEDSSHVQAYNAGTLVPHATLEDFKQLKDGEQIETKTVKRYGAHGARPVTTWHTHTNVGGKLKTSSRGG